MTKQRKKTHKSTKIECAEARPNKKDKVAQDSGNEVYDGIEESANKEISTLSVLMTFISNVVGVYTLAVGQKIIAYSIFSLFAAIVLGKVLKARFKQSVATCVLAAILCFGTLTTMSLAALGYVQISDKNDDDSDQIAVDQNQLSENNVETEEPLASQKVHESVDSTESPPSSREIPFEDQIESRVWSELLNEVRRIGVTGTSENFESLGEAALRVMDNYVPDLEPVVWRSANYGKLKKNVDKVRQLGHELNWDGREVVCDCQVENFKVEPAMNNAHLMGQSGLDCLFEMGMVNGKGKKTKNADIYNIKNIVRYGGVAIDGFAGYWYLEKEKGGYGGDSYYLGEVFHHLGDASELTTESFSVFHLILSAIFYKQVIGDDDDIYRKGLASEQQYKGCKNIAIVFDKLDNKLKPEDPYFLLQADRYYTNAFFNSNLSSEERAKLESYLSSVEEKKAKRGIPLI